MSDLFNIATIVLAGLVYSTLQLNFGALILLYQSSMSQHSRRKTRYLAKSYIWGVGAVSFLLCCVSCFVISLLFDGRFDASVILILAGLLLGTAVVFFTTYYRKTKSTELWLPRSVTRFISRKAKQVDDNYEAFSLGIISSFLELPLFISLYLIAANAILILDVKFQILGIAVFVLFTIIPLFFLKLRIKSGKNAIDAQRWRLRHLTFLRIVSGFSFLLLAGYLIVFWVLK